MGPFIFPSSKPTQCLISGSSVLNLTSNERTMQGTSVNDTFPKGSSSEFKQDHFPYLNREAIKDYLLLSFSFWTLLQNCWNKSRSC